MAARPRPSEHTGREMERGETDGLRVFLGRIDYETLCEGGSFFGVCKLEIKIFSKQAYIVQNEMYTVINVHFH